ncbi:hypothetical protein C3F09_05720 [candidate division GN15 bacterium]|uniref:PRC-barrel domain-containing protein n=1 Tax=candidate division GN15 bacterium TaxID=2072418 RepID=A0A855X1F4_9BACT|nr:MAG: hypothetical protein C3F09_05720 [candidate division GN15 bacterium]
MQYSARNIIGCAILARDGLCGEVRDVLFGDDSWKIRYVVSRAIVAGVNRDFQLAIEAIHSLNLHNRSIRFSGTVGEAQSKTHIDQDPPVSRQQQLKRNAIWLLSPIYEIDFTWGSNSIQTVWPAFFAKPAADEASKDGEISKKYDPHLRSSREVMGYRVYAPNGKVGRVVDILFDDVSQSVTDMVVQKRRFWWRMCYLLSAADIHGISWPLMRVSTLLDTNKLRPMSPGAAFVEVEPGAWIDSAGRSVQHRP